VIASASTRAEAPFDRLATVGARHFRHSRVRTWNTVAATNQNANQDESDLWKGDSTSCDVDGKKRQTNARRMRCLNKSASGNRLGQNDPHPPAIDDKDFSGVLRGGLRKLRDQKPHKPFVALLQLGFRVIISSAIFIEYAIHYDSLSGSTRSVFSKSVQK
jgi:hypothetical protein